MTGRRAGGRAAAAVGSVARVPVVWTTAFLDLPAAVHDAGGRFWCAVTRSTLSPSRGAAGAFATLLPPDGDPYLRVQRTGEGPRVHVDLHVADVDAHVALARGLGARELHREDHVVLASPGGFVLCLVRDGGERRRPEPVAAPGAGVQRVDQVCLDVPQGLLDTEVAFWSALTGWTARAGSRPEFTVLDRPDGIPLRLMLQRLGADDPRTSVGAHLDLACGPTRVAVAAAHRAQGARDVAEGHGWTVLRDPAGLAYCLTGRDPGTGVVTR